MLSAGIARAALPPCDAAPCASDEGRPAAILAYYRGRDETNMIRAERRSGMPANTPVFYGYYWGTLPHPVHLPPPPPPPPGPRPELPDRRFAPIFSLAYTEFFKRRELDADARRTLRDSGEPSTYTHHIPKLDRILRLGAAARYGWGLELGRRYRDRIRIKRAKGLSVTTWQFDELRNEVDGPDGYRLRQLTLGVLRGLAYGRPQLGDAKLPGIVYATVPALRLAARQGDASLARFWAGVDDTTLFFVGEEYPDFTGSASAAAERFASYRSAMERGDPARRSLAAKYVVGVTPGARLLPGLGGNVHHRSRSAVRRWRLAFVRARAATLPAGLGQYNFTFENAAVPVMDDALAALATGVRLAGGG